MSEPVPERGRLLAMRPSYLEEDVGPSIVPEQPPRKRSRALFWFTCIVVMAALGGVLALGWKGAIPIPTHLIETAANLLPASHPITGLAPEKQQPGTLELPSAGLERMTGDLDQLRAAVAELVANHRKTSAAVDSLQQELRTLQEQLRGTQLELRKPAAPTTGWFSDPDALTFRPPVPTRVGATAARKAPAAKKAAAPKNEAPAAEPR